MIIIDSLYPGLTDKSNIKTAITVGKFEALHQGHYDLIKATINYANNNSLCPAVLSFVPNPVQVLHDKNYKPLLTTKESYYLLETTKVSYWIKYPFDENTSRMSPKDFCQLLKSQFNCKALLVGEGFRFGYNQAGTQSILQDLGRELGIEIITIPTTQLDGEKISTSKIRTRLARGEIQEANRLSGSPFTIHGVVEMGRQLGRTIGFPTANIYPHNDKFLPPDGVYASKVFVWNRAFYPLGIGVTSIGTNPTIAKGQSRRVET
ncbi:MAG: hypothetical protein FWC91_01600, partial [Defluviitaleaceae bacterium]|nr:hypothetical protein [Defluviitaleaceae bacterium]